MIPTFAVPEVSFLLLWCDSTTRSEYPEKAPGKVVAMLSMVAYGAGVSVQGSCSPWAVDHIPGGQPGEEGQVAAEGGHAHGAPSSRGEVMPMEHLVAGGRGMPMEHNPYSKIKTKAPRHWRAGPMTVGQKR